MKVALVQLSDIHIQTNNDLIFELQEAFYRSCKSQINECEKLVFIITGDIASRGSEAEYEIALNWLKECEDLWKKEASSISVEYVIVPGNHDCDFSTKDEVREIVIKDLSQKDFVGSGNTMSNCLSVQKNFWSFYSKLIGKELNPEISWVHEVLIDSTFKIVFNCYNTAFLSQLNERIGGLIIPKDKFIEQEPSHSNGIVVSLYHHSTGWLNPNTPLNNKKVFEDHIFLTSDVVMCGHEHSNQDRKISSLSDYRELIYLESSAFQYDGASQYSLITLDTQEKFLTHYQFEYSISEKAYKLRESPASLEMQKKHSGILFEAEWENKLGDISIPLKHTKKTTLRLPDIFIYPDLEPLSDIKREYIQYIDSEKILEESFVSERIIFLEGEAQSGKTSLLRMLHSSWHKKGVYPIMLLGKNIKHYNVSDILRQAYKEQYQHKKYGYDQYEQLDRGKKVILIDDFDKSSINNQDESKLELFKRLLCNFEKVIVTTNIQMSAYSILLDLEDNLKRFKIVSLGYQKRNALIEKWVKLGEDLITLNEQDCLEQVKHTYDSISALLGEQLIPSYPVFILSLLQGLNQVVDKFDTSQTSYAFCYNSLIIASFFNSGMEKDHILGVLKILSEFAYHRYIEYPDKRYFDQNEFELFYSSYKESYYVQYSTDSLLQNLCKANIIRCESDNSYSFSYKYIFYYLVAQKIAQLVLNDEVDGLVKRLCENLHKEQEANILIFLVFHSGTNKQLEDLLFASMLPFEDQKPITLNTSDPLFKGINDIVAAIKSDVIHQGVNPKKHREEVLKNSDELNRRIEAEDSKAYLTEKDFEENSYLRDINSTFKIIQILGQIVKNHRDTLKKDDLLNLIEESYNVCFRSISFFGTLVQDLQEDIIEHFRSNHKGQSQMPEGELRAKVYKLLHTLLFRQCLSSFSNLSRAIGMSNSHELFQQVAARMGTPAAKIISFTINTYHNKIKIKDLEDLVSEYRNNAVVMKIIKMRVLNYVYNNHVKYDQCQKIGQICGLRLVDSPRILTSPHRSNRVQP